jgi:hypothetical protein
MECSLATHRLVIPDIDIDVCEFLPRHELARCAVDRLTCKFERPLVLTLTPQEVALRVEQEIRLWSLLHRSCHYLYSLDFLV